jgi:CRISPR-associated protein (TIGR03986 family)
MLKAKRRSLEFHSNIKTNILHVVKSSSHNAKILHNAIRHPLFSIGITKFRKMYGLNTFLVYLDEPEIFVAKLRKPWFMARHHPCRCTIEDARRSLECNFFQYAEGGNIMSIAKAPYNFVPLSDRIVEGEAPPDMDRYHKDRHTGWFDIEITALTPIYTRSASDTNNTAGIQPSAFFSRPDGQYALPGSGLRGMIRSIFEIITLSEIEFYSKRRLLYRSFADSVLTGNIRQLYQDNFKKERLVAGILEKRGGIFSLKVSRESQKGFVLINENEIPSYLKIRDRDVFPSPVQGNVQILDDTNTAMDVAYGHWNKQENGNGYLIIPGKDVGNNRKYFQVILKPEENNCDSYVIPTDVYEDYIAWGKMSHGSRFGTSNAPRMLENGSPAFALLDENGNVFVIGANMMMPMRYKNSIDDVVARNNKGNAHTIDMTKSVFGGVSESKSDSKNAAIRGRVFFEDSLCDDGGREALLNPANPVFSPVLGGPKPTSFQMYLEQLDDDKKIHWDDSMAKIRGYKLYWHRTKDAAKDSLSNASENSKTKVSTKIEPLRSGVKFHGRIRFENLSDKELGALYASIQLPSNMAHHFGMAKNLGLGSVRVEITKTSLLNMEKRLSDLSKDAGVISPSESLGILEKAYHTFLESIYPGKHTLWSNTRMKTLSRILRYQPPLPIENTIQISIDDKSNRQWKDRYVLPDAMNITISMDGEYASWTPEDIFPFPVIKKADEHKKNEKTAKSKPASYRVNDKVEVEVLEISNSTRLGRVRLPDNKILKDKSLPVCNVGDMIKMKVIKVDGNGNITDLKI